MLRWRSVIFTALPHGNLAIRTNVVHSDQQGGTIEPYQARYQEG